MYETLCTFYQHAWCRLVPSGYIFTLFKLKHSRIVTTNSWDWQFIFLSIKTRKSSIGESAQFSSNSQWERTAIGLTLKLPQVEFERFHSRNSSQIIRINFSDNFTITEKICLPRNFFKQKFMIFDLFEASEIKAYLLKITWNEQQCLSLR